MIYLAISNNRSFRLFKQGKEGKVKTKTVLRKFLKTKWRDTYVNLEEMIEFYKDNPKVVIYELDCSMDLLNSIEDVKEYYPEYTL